jgi:ABC-type branched-subunit amino acid transport system ATPase component
MGGLLTANDLVAGYGAGVALHRVSVEVGSREIVCLLGPNGAGKTTLLRTLAGLIRPRSGQVLLDGRDVTSLPAHRRARLGIALVPEERSAFSDLTVDQNLRLGAVATRHAHRSASLAQRRARVFELFPRLGERGGQLASTLSGGEQKMLVIGRALMSDPRLLLVDEPSQGLAPQALDVIIAALRELHDSAEVAIVVAEQNTERALSWADRAYVLSTGTVRHAGPAAELEADEALMEKLYLGDRVEG